MNYEEAKIQSECVRWLRNTKPETHGLFFCVNNNSGISIAYIKGILLNIIKNPKDAIKIASAAIKKLASAMMRSGAQNKSMGVIAGVSDTILLWNGIMHCIEFKTAKGRQSAEQKRWEKKVVANGGKYYVIRSLDEFIKLICKILSAT